MNEIEVYALLYTNVLNQLMEDSENLKGRPTCPDCGLPMVKMAMQMADARWLYTWLCNCITPTGEHIDAEIFAHDRGVSEKTDSLLEALK